MGLPMKKGKVTNIPVIVVNHDKTILSNQVVDMLDDNQNIKVLNYVDKNQLIVKMR